MIRFAAMKKGGERVSALGAKATPRRRMMSKEMGLKGRKSGKATGKK